MQTKDKQELLHQLSGELQALAMSHGDPHPLLAVQIIDTDPDPMPGSYVQCSLSFRFPLPQD